MSEWINGWVDRVCLCVRIEMRHGVLVETNLHILLSLGSRKEQKLTISIMVVTLI